MDWAEILNTIIVTLIGTVGTVLVGLASWGITKLVTWLKSKTANIESETLRTTVDSLIDGIAGAVTDAVKSSVDYIENWSEDKVSSALGLVKDNLTDEDYEYILTYEISEEKIAEDGKDKAIDDYLTELINAEVYNLREEAKGEE